MQSVDEIEQRIVNARRTFDGLRAEMARMIVGHEELVEQVFIALVCGGHCLLEGVPGLGKTLMVRSLGETLSLSFSRIQFTPDLMPADITGTNMLTDDPSGRKIFEFQRGPLFAHIVLADEINRATPKPSRRYWKRCRNRASPSAARCIAWKILLWCWRRKILSKWKAPILCPRRKWIDFFSNCYCSSRAARSWRGSPI